MREIVEGRPALRARRARPTTTALAVFADQPYKREIIEKVRAGDADRRGRGRGRRRRRRLGVPQRRATATASFVDLCRGPARAVDRSGSARSSSRRSRARTGAATRRARCSSASTAPRGSRRPRSTSTCTGSRRPSSATTASSASSSTCSRSPRRSAPASRCSTRRAALVRRIMEDYSRQRHEAAGYEFVNSPHITKADLFETSGHLDWFADGMFPPMELDEGGDARLLPQADELPVPHPDLQQPHAVVPRAAAAALRVRHACTATRSRASCTGSPACAGMTQDDAHIFCTKEQMADELASLLDFVLDLLRDYGLDDFYLELSTKPEGKAVGTDEEWDEATEALRDGRARQGPRARARRGRRRVLRPEDLGAGHATRSAARGRCRRSSSTSRCRSASTSQYVGADNERHRPIMIHRALFGSVERFFARARRALRGRVPGVARAGAGRRCCPVADRHDAYASDVVDRLKAEGFRAEVLDGADEHARRRASAGRRSRRCRTCSWSATTTSSTAPSA